MTKCPEENMEAVRFASLHSTRCSFLRCSTLLGLAVSRTAFQAPPLSSAGRRWKFIIVEWRSSTLTLKMFIQRSSLAAFMIFLCALTRTPKGLSRQTHCSRMDNSRTKLKHLKSCKYKSQLSDLNSVKISNYSTNKLNHSSLPFRSCVFQFGITFAFPHIKDSFVIFSMHPPQDHSVKVLLLTTV